MENGKEKKIKHRHLKELQDETKMGDHKFIMVLVFFFFLIFTSIPITPSEKASQRLLNREMVDFLSDIK